MTELTPNLTLPYILAAQAQKHVTHNEAIRALDALTQLGVLDRGRAAPPPAPAEGDRYIAASGATGAWAGQDGNVAAFQDGAWMFYAPRPGWLAYAANEQKLYAFDGTTWQRVQQSLNPAPLIGVNTTADATNRLAVVAPASLLSHDGAGHQLKINKATAPNTASLLFQTDYAGRAEIGTTGDDQLHVKVSEDGTVWHDALLVERATGEVVAPLSPAMARPNLLLNGDFSINQRNFVSGNLVAGAFGYDRWKAGSGGATLGLVGTTLTLTSGSITQVIIPAEWGYATLAGRPVTLSVDSMPSGTLAITIGSTSGTLTGGIGRRSLTLTVPTADTGFIAVTLAEAGGTITFGHVKLELGAIATAWAPRPRPAEFAACQRYFQRNPANPAYFAVSWNPSYITTDRIRIGVAMRSTPLIELDSGPGTSHWTYLLNGSYQVPATSTPGDADANGFAVTVHQPSVFTTGLVYFVRGGWRASAEA